MRVAGEGNQHGNRQPGQHGQREFEPVVGMKLEFGQQVRAGNAQEGARAKRQRGPYHRGVALDEMRGAQVRQQHAQRRHQRKQPV